MNRAHPNAVTPTLPRRGMIKALLWKEWHEQRPVVAAGVGLSLAMPLLGFSYAWAVGSRAYISYYAELVPFLMAALVWPVFAAISGVTANADRSDRATLGFLLSRPISRAWLWSVKIATALGALSVIVAFSLGVAQVIWLTATERLTWSTTAAQAVGLPFAAWASVSTPAVPAAAVRAMVVGGVLVVVSSALLLSLLTRHAIAAALGSLLVSMFVVVAGYLVGSALAADPSFPRGIETFLMGFLTAAAAGMLGATYSLFLTDSEPHGSRSCGRVFVAVGIVVAASTSGAVASAAFAIDLGTSSVSQMQFVATAPTHSVGLVRVDHLGLAGRSYWLVGPDEPLRRITPRMTRTADFVPGGELIAYDTRRGLFGRRRELCSLRAVRFDGSEDRLVHDALSCGAERAFSRDGSRVAVRIDSDALTVLSLDGDTPPRHLDFTGTPAEASSPRRWVSGDRGIVLEGHNFVHIVDVDTGAIREVFRDDELSSLVIRSWADGEFLARFQRMGGWIDVLVDLARGAVRDLGPDCPGLVTRAVFSRDSGYPLWFGCRSEGDAGSTLWMRDTMNGVDTELAGFEGSIRTLTPSPGGTHVVASAVSRMSRYAQVWRLVTVDRFGHVRDLAEALGYRPPRLDDTGQPVRDPRDWIEPSWNWFGWFDESTLALERYLFTADGQRRQQFAYFDLSSGDPVIMVDAETRQ